MARTDIDFTEDELEAVARIADATGRLERDVIREAIDQYIERQLPADESPCLRAAFGIWRDRADIPLHVIRDEFDRF